MGIIYKLLRFLFSVYGFLIFLLIFLILFPFFFAAFFLNQVQSGNTVIRLARVWSDLFFFFTFIKPIIIYEEEPKQKQEYMFVSNHISYIDIPMMLASVRKRDLRILGKAEMNKIPLFGQVYKRGAVTVNRESAKARAASIQKMVNLISRGVSVFICPEGTFNTTHNPLKEFYDGAFRIAIETQKPIMPIVFPDTYDRLHYNSIFSLTPGRCRAVFLPVISTNGLTLQEIHTLKQRVYEEMAEALKRYDASWIGKSKNSEYVTGTV